MANNKVQLSDGTVLIDTSAVTVTPAVLASGYTALDKSGQLITGQIEVYDGTVLVIGITVDTSARSGVTYNNGIDNIAPSRLSEIAKAISNNANITNSTKTIYVDYYDGNDEAHYKIDVGNTITINVNSKDYPFRIIGFNHDDLTSETAYGEATATGKAGITFQMVDCLDTKYQMNGGTHTNEGGWYSSTLRATLNSSDIKGKVAANWTNIIKTVEKKSSHGNTSSAIQSTNDDLFLLSEIEIFGSTTYSVEGEGTVYAYWSENNTESARIKYSNGEVWPWWTRSPREDNTRSFCTVTNTGKASSTTSNNTYAVSFGFCV